MIDAIVVGAGLNGLVAAAVLARAGKRVVVVERRPEVGGLAEVLTDTSRVLPAVVAELGLTLRPAPKVHLDDGTVLDDRPEVVRWRDGIERWRPLVRHLVDRPAPRVGADTSPWAALQTAVAFRRLGDADLLELLRIGPMAVEDWLEEHVTDPALRGALALDGLFGTWMGPRSPGSAATLLLRALTAGHEVDGGPAALISAATEACRRAEIRTGAEVARIRVDRGEVRGVALADGVEIDAPVVLSAVDPRRTLALLDSTETPPAIEADLRAHRCRGTHSIVRIRRSGPERLRVGCDPVAIERAFDAVKYGATAAEPPLDVRGDTVVVFGTPYDLRDGWTDARRDDLGEQVGRRLEAEVLEVLTPPDLERRYGCTGGHLHHGEDALDQLWIGRPSLALSGHTTPVRGLVLASGGTHPGGGLTGGPGWHAARAVLR